MYMCPSRGKPVGVTSLLPPSESWGGTQVVRPGSRSVHLQRRLTVHVCSLMGQGMCSMCARSSAEASRAPCVLAHRPRHLTVHVCSLICRGMCSMCALSLQSVFLAPFLPITDGYSSCANLKGSRFCCGFHPLYLRNNNCRALVFQKPQLIIAA